MENIKHFWLLHLARHCPADLDRLFPIAKTQSFNVRDYPGYRPFEYAQDLIELLRSGEITAKVDGKECSFDDAARVIEEHSNGLGRNDASFRLTKKGGAQWETFAQPQWGRFVLVEDDFGSDLNDRSTSSRIASRSADAIVAYLGWYKPLRNHAIRTETIIWAMHERYNLTYWKSLNDVHEATFMTSNIVPEGDEYEEPSWLREWWFARANWYVSPWDHPDWPPEEKV